MKTKSFIFLALPLSILIESCSVYSVYPLYTEDNLVMNDQLIGLWKEAEDGKSFLLITKNEDKSHPSTYLEKSYSLTYWEREDTLSFDAHYLKLGNDYFMDLLPNKNEALDLMMNNYFPVHSFQKIILNGPKITVLMFDGEKMIQLFRQNRIRLKHELLDDVVLITAGTDDLQKFIQKYSSNTESFTDPMIFERIK